MTNIVDNANYVIALSVLRDIVREDIESMVASEGFDPNTVAGRKELVGMLSNAIEIMIIG
jgi:hypothetical protein